MKKYGLTRALTQREPCASSPHVETILFTASEVRFLASDLNHAIVKRGCRDTDIIELSARMDYVLDPGDGSFGTMPLEAIRACWMPGSTKPIGCAGRSARAISGSWRNI